MASSNDDPVFDFSLKHWPPIYRYKRKASQETIKAELRNADPPPAPAQVNLVTALSEAIERPEQTPRSPSPAPSELTSVPLMNPYPVTFSPPLPEFLPPLSPSPPAFSTIQHIGPSSSPSSTPPQLVGSSSQLVGSFQQFGVAPGFSPNNLSLGFQPMTSLSPAFWPHVPNSSPAASVMGVPGDFPPLHALPPTFWEPVVRLPEPERPQPMHTPPTPTLENLAGRTDGKGENFSDERLKAIIIKAQPHHSERTLAHLTRAQLIKHVDDLVAWWKTTHPQQAIRPPQTSANTPQQEQQQRAFIQARHQQRLQGAGVPPASPAVQASVASAGASAAAQEKVISQCPCCCEAQQNAAFSPCGHLYACTRCAHRLYDNGRGKCPVCRVPIQTYLKIYATG
jgi:hypothetical protein